MGVIEVKESLAGVGGVDRGIADCKSLGMALAHFIVIFPN